MKKLPHLISADESYHKHALNAAKYAVKLFYAGMAVLIHMVYPQWHQNTASNIAKEIAEDVENRHKEAKTNAR
jgi:predicted Na+-dependent transporter